MKNQSLVVRIVHAANVMSQVTTQNQILADKLRGEHLAQMPKFLECLYQIFCNEFHYLYEIGFQVFREFR